MLICKDCGAVFDTPSVFREKHSWLDDCPSEYFSMCPVCGCGDLAEATQCINCGEETDGEQMIDGLLCDECFETLCGDCDDTVKEFMTEHKSEFVDFLYDKLLEEGRV